MFKNGKAFVALLALFLANLFAWNIVYQLNQEQPFEVVFFDVGQGDSALIKTHLGHYILIDAGDGKDVLDKLSKEIPFYRKDIDLIVLSHDHADHLGGFLDLVESYDITNILWNGVSGESTLSARWKREIDTGDYNVKIARLGQRISADDFFIDVLYPFDDISGDYFNDLNLSSVVVRVVYKDKSFLFMGDAYKENEEELIAMNKFCQDKREELICRGMILDSDVLKVGHHGSRTSTSENFIELVDPSLAIISAGEDNRYGHPHPETLELLERYGIRIARTDLEGDIKIRINHE